MASRLKTYFPMIRERTEILQLIGDNERLNITFSRWNEAQQNEFLDMCSGMKGVKILYDAFFKEIMNPEYTPERLNEFLSLLLNRQVKIRTVLPNDSTRITDESSLLITDIVVELEDGSLANIEIQRIGYMFPGQRCACYSADLLLRQYRRIRSSSGNTFNYKDIKSVYTIVLFERSPQEFGKYPEIICHSFRQSSDSGLKMELLQKYVFVPLDIFRKSLHNKGIRNKLEAWLAFLCEDDPEIIISLMRDWPEFKPMYAEIYDMCRNIEGVMEMFSKELLELDRNTVQYMIDEMQETIDQQKKELEEIGEKKQKLEAECQRAEAEIQRAEAEIQRAEAEIQRAEAEIQRAEAERQRADAEIQRVDAERQKAEQKMEQEKQRAEEAERQVLRLKALLAQKGITEDTKNETEGRV